MRHVEQNESVPLRRLSDDALTRLYTLYYPKIYNHVYYRILEREQTEDLVSDIFVKVVRGYPGFDPKKASFSTWVFHITHNTLIDYYRSNRNTVPLDQENVPEPSCEDEYRGLDDHARQVRQLLVYLDDEERELIYLKYHEEKTNSEISALLDMNPSTVSTKLSRALAKMRAHAGGDHDA